jgi:hypothetical protein
MKRRQSAATTPLSDPELGHPKTAWRFASRRSPKLTPPTPAMLFSSVSIRGKKFARFALFGGHCPWGSNEWCFFGKKGDGFHFPLI